MRSTVLRLTLPLLLLALCLTLNGCFVFVPAPPPVDTSDLGTPQTFEKAGITLHLTDKFKEEWRANADWLQLAFHSRTEFPAAPYRHGDAATVTADYEAVRREVLRFAGKEAFSDDVTTVHFGAANEEVLRALRALGIKGLAGYFEIDRHGDPLVAYHTASPLTEYVGERDFWRDTELGITFGRIDLVLNLRSYDNLLAELDSILAHPHRSGFISLMIHEQYFYKDYKRHLPDFEARVLEPVRRVCERGYQGALLKEILP